VRLESLDGAFGYVAAMHVGGDELVGAVPVFSDDSTVFSTGFVVQNLVVNGVCPCCKSSHEVVVGWDAVSVVAGLEGFDEDGVGVTVVGQHEVLVAAARPYGEASHVVREELADGFVPQVEFFGGSRRDGRGR
jgi:hypothetical protein